MYAWRCWWLYAFLTNLLKHRNVNYPKCKKYIIICKRLYYPKWVI